MTQENIGSYRIIERIGEGGMGVVYSARDERLGRSVAIKMLPDSANADSRDRLWREARMAASVSHPNVCQIYDVLEQDGRLYVAMELLAGEPLSSRIAQSAIPAPAAIDLAIGMLDALEALHARGIVHRDLKPGNVFVTPHGVKILDFGLAKPFAEGSGADLTAPDQVLGTPRYMAPEQWAGRPASPVTDLFACGAILYEMLAGRAAFDAPNPAALCFAITSQQPPPLRGSATIEAIDLVIQRALSKDPARRFATATEMARALRSARVDSDSTRMLTVRPLRRLAVLPFRLLRPDSEIDFLAFGLSDAITSALSGLRELVVRSSRASGRFADGQPDLKALAAELDIDVALFGTLLRGGDRVRLRTELVEVPSGTVLHTSSAEGSVQDVLALQDDLAAKVVESLKLELSPEEKRGLHAAAPSHAAVQELFVRANDLASRMGEPDRLKEAIELYESVAEKEPNFAPVWPRLARLHRIFAKFGYGDFQTHREKASAAFQRAFELDPDLPITHNYYTYFEIENLRSAPSAMSRLLSRLAGGLPEPELWAALVAALRFCGLMRESLAADQRAKRLDPAIRTSVKYTHFLLGDYASAIATDVDGMAFMRLNSAAMTDDPKSAIATLREAEERFKGLDAKAVRLIRLAVENDRDACVREIRNYTLNTFPDPEGLYFGVRCAARFGEIEAIAPQLESIVDAGFLCDEMIASDPWFASIHADPRLAPILARSRERRAASRQMFRAAGGEKLLGVSVEPTPSERR